MTTLSELKEAWKRDVRSCANCYKRGTAVSDNIIGWHLCNYHDGVDDALDVLESRITELTAPVEAPALVTCDGPTTNASARRTDHTVPHEEDACANPVSVAEPRPVEAEGLEWRYSVDSDYWWTSSDDGTWNISRSHGVYLVRLGESVIATRPTLESAKSLAAALARVLAS